MKEESYLLNLYSIKIYVLTHTKEERRKEKKKEIH